MGFTAKAILAVIAIILIGFLISLLLPILAIIGALTICWLIYKLMSQNIDEVDEKKPP